MSHILTRQFLERAVRDKQGAAEAATEMTLITMREEGLLRRYMKPKPITAAETTPQLNTSKPAKIVEKEVLQPYSASVPFGTLPSNFTMSLDKYQVTFARLMTKSYNADIKELETYSRDVEEFFKERAVTDMLYAEDIPFFATLDAIVAPVTDGGTWNGGNENSALGALSTQRSALTGKVQYYDWTDADSNPLGSTAGFTRVNFLESLKILRKGFRLAGQETIPIRTAPKVGIINYNTALEFAKLDHDAFGGPGAEDMLKDGVTEQKWGGMRWIYTSKDDIVKDGEAYILADPDYVGIFYEMDQPTMFLEIRAFMLEFFIYSCIGNAIGNPLGVTKIKFF